MKITVHRNTPVALHRKSSPCHPAASAPLYCLQGRTKQRLLPRQVTPALPLLPSVMKAVDRTLSGTEIEGNLLPTVIYNSAPFYYLKNSGLHNKIKQSSQEQMLLCGASQELNNKSILDLKDKNERCGRLLPLGNSP